MSLIKVGESLAFTYPGLSASAAVQSDGNLLVEGVLYETLSAAGAALRGGPTNGWAYWASTEQNGNQVALADLRARYLTARASGSGAIVTPVPYTRGACRQRESTARIDGPGKRGTCRPRPT